MWGHALFAAVDPGTTVGQVTGLALLPLETHSLPGWPQPEAPTGVHMMVVLLVFPAICALVLIALVTVGQLAKTNRATATGVLAERPVDAPELGGPGGSAQLTTGASGTTTVNTDLPAEQHVEEQIEAGLAQPRH